MSNTVLCSRDKAEKKKDKNPCPICKTSKDKTQLTDTKINLRKGLV